MKEKVKSKLRQYEITVLIYDRIKEFYYKWLVSDKQLIKREFKKRMDRDLELDNPKKFNDKLQWLKLNWYDPLAIKCADKYSVREVVERRIGKEYLNVLIAAYDSVDEIDIDKLPDKFVLKGTHGSGFNIICEDKNKVNWKNEFKIMKKWLRKNYYYQNREWMYKDIKPRIICEEFLSDVNGDLPKDYKFFCFNGEPKFMFVASDRGQETKFDFFDLNWGKIPVSQYYPNSNYEIPKPNKLDEMLELSRKLSRGFPHVRVDFYVIKEKVIFGELTFFHFSGSRKFNPEKYDEVFGDHLDLSKVSKKKYKGEYK